MHSSLNQWYGLCYCVYLCTCALYVHSSFQDSSLNQQYRLMLLVHLCTLCAPSESSLNQLKMLLALYMCQKCSSYFLFVGQKAASSISLQKSLWNSLEPCTFSRNTHPAIWCLTKLEYNGMSFNLISQQVCA